MQQKPSPPQHYLQEWADFAGKTPAEIAKHTGADKSLVSRWLGGEVMPGLGYRVKLADLFGTDQGSLLNPPPRSELRRVPMSEVEDPPRLDPDRPLTIGEHTASDIPEDASAQLDVTAGMGGGGVTIIAEGVPGRQGMTFAAEHVSDYWRIPQAILSAMGLHARDVVMIPVQGDSMQPTLFEGEIVIVDTRHRWPSPDGLYALNDVFGGIVVKRLELTSKPTDEVQMIAVKSDNPRHETRPWRFDELRIVGRVLRRFGVVQ